MPTEDATRPPNNRRNMLRSSQEAPLKGPPKAPLTVRSALRPVLLRVLRLALSQGWVRAAGRRALARVPRLERRLRGIAGRAGLIAAPLLGARSPSNLTPRAARIYRLILATERRDG